MNEIEEAVYARLVTESLTGDQATAQTALASQLATDSDSPSGPAVFQGNRDDNAGFPQFTFRIYAGSEALDAADSGQVFDWFLDGEIWGNTRSGSELSNIEDNLDILLDERRGAPSLALGTYDRYFYMERMTAGGPPGYDDTINAWFRLVRYRIVAGRA